MLNAVGDLIDLRNALNPSQRKNISKLTPEEIMEFVLLSGHCSALVKVSGLMFYNM